MIKIKQENKEDGKREGWVRGRQGWAGREQKWKEGKQDFKITFQEGLQCFITADRYFLAEMHLIVEGDW